MDLTRISGRIPKEVIEYAEKNAFNTQTLFVAFLQIRYGVIVERTFACRRYKNGVKITEVRRRCSDGKSKPVMKNLLYGNIAGYRAVYEPEDKVSRSYGFSYKVFSKEDFDVWHKMDYDTNFYCIYLNTELIFQIPKYKYCGYTNGDVIQWLKRYEEDPGIEMFGKFRIPLSPVLTTKARKEKPFRKWLMKNAYDVRLYGVNAAVYAYEHNETIENARRITSELRNCARAISELKGTEINRKRLNDYLEEKKIDYILYNDYLKAIKALNIDLKDTKNIYPKNFRVMHDLRTSQHQAKIDNELQEKFNKAILKNKWVECEGDTYVIILPKTISDLRKEGESLHHCVGKLGYDSKMANGKSVICFCRELKQRDVPFVTIELDAETKKIKQRYGDHNSTPSNEVISFIEKWAKEIQRKEKIKCMT